nr:DUF3501 family protein [Bacilli bacterium]
MKNVITLEDLAALTTYRQSREAYVSNMIQYKKARRVKLAPAISLLFENRETVLYQIRELAHSEDLEDPKELQEYINIYDGMLPQDKELSGTLFIESDDQVELEKMLVALKGIEFHLSLHIGDVAVQAAFEEVHDDREFTTSVHYLKFPMTDQAISALQQAQQNPDVPVGLVLDHPNLFAKVQLTKDTVDSIMKDL